MLYDHAKDDHHSGHRNSPGGHSHPPADFGRAFVIGITLNAAYVLAEAFFGIASHSLALLADAGHNASDVLGLFAAWGAAAISKKRPGGRYTYGLRGSTILAALANAVVLLVVTGGIAWEAIRRLQDPEPAAGIIMIVVAAIGVLINGGTALLFMAGRKHDLNIKGAFLHMASDAIVTLGVVLAGALMLWTGWLWLDPAISLVISVVIVAGTWSLLRDSINLALSAVPAGIDREDVERYLASLPRVTSVHDLHIWGMSTTETALTAHLVCADPGSSDHFLHEAAHELEERFGIHHATLQLETGDGAHACRLAPDEVV